MIDYAWFRCGTTPVLLTLWREVVLATRLVKQCLSSQSQLKLCYVKLTERYWVSVENTISNGRSTHKATRELKISTHKGTLPYSGNPYWTTVGASSWLGILQAGRVAIG